MIKKNLLILGFFTGIIIFWISHFADRFSRNISVNQFMDSVFEFFRLHCWESMAVSSLILGMWFSLVRRRVLISIFFLLVAFLCSFVLPQLISSF